MKAKLKVLLLAVVTLTVFSSCDKADELTEFDANATFTPTLSVDLPNTSKSAENAPTSKTWNTSTTVDLTSNPDISDHLDHIKSITINSLSYKISNYTGPEDSVASDITITFGDKVIALDNISTIKEESNAGTEFKISDSATLTAIVNKLKSDKMMTISSVGTVSNASSAINFDIKITIDMTFTIDVI